jgi:hypothetical protein
MQKLEYWRQGANEETSKLILPLSKVITYTYTVNSDISSFFFSVTSFCLLILGVEDDCCIWSNSRTPPPHTHTHTHSHTHTQTHTHSYSHTHTLTHSHSHTLTRTLSRTLLDKSWTHRRKLCLTTHSTHKRQTSVSLRGSNPQSHQTNSDKSTPYSALPAVPTKYYYYIIIQFKTCSKIPAKNRGNFDISISNYGLTEEIFISVNTS